MLYLSKLVKTNKLYIGDHMGDRNTFEISFNSFESKRPEHKSNKWEESLTLLEMMTSLRIMAKKVNLE